MDKLVLATRLEIAETLLRAADGTIPEDEFWQRFRSWSMTLKDPRIMIAWEEADHYWSNFHRKNIFFIRVKPDENQLEQGREALRLLAKAFGDGWVEERIEKELRQI